MAQLPRDQNFTTVSGAVSASSDSAASIRALQYDPTTRGLTVHVYGIKGLSTLYASTKTVPVGTAEAIASTQAVVSVTVKALSTNTVPVYVGPSGVTTSGFELLAGESVTMEIDDLATIFVISGSTSQIIRYIAV